MRHSILLVEDNDGDAELTKIAFKEVEANASLTIFQDGEVALDYLKEATEKSQLPNMIILDLNLPKISGFDILNHIKENDELKKIPVLILTSSSSERDRIQCYMNHASAYLTKPNSFAQFIELVKLIDKFWFNFALLPKT